MSTTAYLSQLHQQYLPEDKFTVCGSMIQHFSARNRRAVDVNISQFEDEVASVIDRSNWGLPTPNKEAAYKALSRYGKDTPSLDPQQIRDMNQAFNWMERQFGPHMCESKVLDLQSAIDRMDKTTSPGKPWVRRFKTKQNMVDEWKEFPKYMTEDWDRLQHPNYVALFGNSLKEEIRLQEKIDQNNLRTFTAGPVEMTLHGIRLFGDMNEKFYKSHLQHASVVGFSPLKGGWNVLYRKLSRFPKGYAMDEKQYDSSLRSYLMWFMAAYRWRMLASEYQTPENWNRLRVYYMNLVNTMIVTSDGVFVRKCIGNPSGSVNTIVDNTLILYGLLAYAWLRNAPPEKRNYSDFTDSLELALCGDDNTWTGSDVALEIMSAKNLMREWGAIGITTTTDCEQPRDLVDLDFLSAYTVFEKDVAVPLYDRSKLLTSLLYTNRPSDPVHTLIRASALARVGWADKQFRKYINELIQWLIKRYGTVLMNDPDWKIALGQVPTQSDLQALFLGKEYRFMKSQGAVNDGIKRDFYNIAMNSNQQVRSGPGGNGIITRASQTKSTQSRPKQRNIKRRRQRRLRQQPGPRRVRQVVARKQPRQRRGRAIARRVSQPSGETAIANNFYLAALLFPAECATCGIPDEFSGPTSDIKLTANIIMPLLFGTMEPDGSYLAFVAPTIVDPITVYQEAILTGTTLSMQVSSQSDDYGFFSVSPSQQAIDTSAGGMILEDTVLTGVAAKWGYDDQDFVTPPFYGVSPDGYAFNGMPFNNDGSSNFTFNITLNRALEAGATINLYSVSATQALTSIHNFVGPQPAEMTASTAVLPILADVPLPGIGFVLRYIPTGAQASITVLNFQAEHKVVGTFTGLRMQTYEYPDQSYLRAITSKFRAVSGLSWMQYTGSSLVDGGLMASLYYGGGESPMAEGLYNYESISVVPTAYSGDLRSGTVMWWAPGNEADILFQKLEAATKWERPWHVIAGRAQTTTVGIPPTLRLRVTFNFELITTSQVLDQLQSPVAPFLISQANAFCAGRQMAMANGTHVEYLKEWLKTGVAQLEKMYNFYRQNSSWINPGVAAAVSFL